MDSIIMDKALRRLARLYGLKLKYFDIWGNEHHVSEDSVRRVLCSLGVEAADLNRELQAEEIALWQEVLLPVKVCRENTSPISFFLTIPESLNNTTFQWKCLVEGAGERKGQINIASLSKRRSKRLGDISYGRYQVQRPDKFPLGYHQFVLTVPRAPEARMMIIVVPEKCFIPEVLEGDKRIWGVSAQLYGLSSKRNWGIGQFSDLLTLAKQVKQANGAFIGLNPLHALAINNFSQYSPYSPTSRNQLNILYLDVEAIDDFPGCLPAQQLVRSAKFQASIAAVKNEEFVPYQKILALKMRVLRALYQHFVANDFARQTPRKAAFEAFCAQGGTALERYAMFEEITAQLFGPDPPSSFRNWVDWELPYRSPDSEGARKIGKNNRQAITFYKYLQWQAHLQLSTVVESAALPLGFYCDLALSADKYGADVWKDQELYALDLEVGCPPDEFNPKGQNWGFPPFKPRSLRHAAYRPFIETLRAGMKYAGAIRLDHVMSLFRLFCIPRGLDGRDGVYVSFPLQDLLGIVCLESVRNRCLVIGEDLGTVPNIVRVYMARYNMLSYKVLLFMKDWNGRFLAPAHYPLQALVTTTTHDTPTIWGWWQKHDIEIRNTLQLYSQPGQYEGACYGREQEKQNLLSVLSEEGLLPPQFNPQQQPLPEFTEELLLAVLKLLAKTPTQILAIPLEDLARQIRQVNLPGVTSEYPSWTRRLPVALEALIAPTFPEDFLRNLLPKGV